MLGSSVLYSRTVCSLLETRLHVFATAGVTNIMLTIPGWVRIQLQDVIKTKPISILMGAKMQRLEVVTGRSEFLSHFSTPQANPTQPVTRLCRWAR